MAGRLKYGPRYRYPHMMADEIEVWERFMERYPERFETVDYDFRVGKGADLKEALEDSYARMATMLSQKRIDAVAWVGDSPTIIEVKKRVGLSALGQVWGYRTLFMNDFTAISIPEVLVVCETISEDDRTVLEGNKVPVEVV